jgi:hypothetical protein
MVTYSFAELKPGYYDRPHKSRRGLSEDGHSSQIEGLFDDGHSSQVETSSVLMDINIEMRMQKELKMKCACEQKSRLLCSCRSLVILTEQYRSIPPGALRTYWLRRVSVSLQNGMANCFYKHVGSIIL